MCDELTCNELTRTWFRPIWACDESTVCRVNCIPLGG